MPQMLEFRVEQTRVAIVTANSLEDAILVASAAFDGMPAPKDVFGTVNTKVTQTHLAADLI